MRQGSEQEGNPEVDVFEAIRTRRSIRKYRPEPIPNEKLNMILEAARLAPSAGNRQPWRFIVVQAADRKKEVAQAADNQTFLSDAAAIVVAVGDPDVSIRWHEKDSMIALEHIVLASTALGYGTCWIGAFDEEALKRLLKIPTKMKVVALLPIGTPRETPAPRPRKKPSEIFFKEQWQTPYASQMDLVKPRRTAEPRQIGSGTTRSGRQHGRVSRDC
jgi:nitroreductase